MISSRTRPQQELYRKSPCNVIRLEYGLESPGDTETDNRYTRAAALLDEWFKKGILRQGLNPAFYIYEMEYKAGDTKKKLRGFICLVRIEDYDSGIVRPHETTLSGPKTDRLNLLRACKACFSQIFSLFSDPEGTVSAILGKTAHKPEMEVKNSDGVHHRIWTLSEPGRHRGRGPRNGGQVSFYRRRASPLRHGAQLPERAAQGGGHLHRRGRLQLRGHVPGPARRPGTHHPPGAPRALQPHGLRAAGASRTI